MKILFSPKTTRELSIFCGALAGLIISIFIVRYIYIHDILPEKKINDEYGVVNCTLIAKTLTPATNGMRAYRADFQLLYTIEGKEYRSFASGNALSKEFSTNEKAQQKLLDQYSLGSTYSCWYNPANPEEVALILHGSWFKKLTLFVPLGVAFLMLYFAGAYGISLVLTYLNYRDEL
jgi:hypothetical protein